MTRWRIQASLVIAMAFTGVASGQSYSLTEAPLLDRYHRLQLTMTVSGTLKLFQDDKEVLLKESATATHEYTERVLESGANGTATSAARVYKDAKVGITIESHPMNRSLRAERNFLIAIRDREPAKLEPGQDANPAVATRRRDGVLMCCPHGPLTRDEVDVTDHFDTLAITGLLPANDVAVGETWTLHPSVVQALCHFQGVSEQALKAKLESVANGAATISVNGTAAGIDFGAEVNTIINATCQFDIEKRCVTSVEWSQKDERGSGPVSPASSMDTTIKVTRSPVESVHELSDVLVPAWAWKGQPPQDVVELEYKDAGNRFDLRHSRDWRLVGRTAEHVVMRLMDRGEFVAQVSIAPWKKAEPGKHLSEDEVKSIVANSPGWAQDSLVGKCEALESPSKQWTYLVPGKGELDGVPAVQYFYFLAGPNGDQVMLTFTMTPAQTQKMGARDREFVQGFLLPGARRDGAELKDGKAADSR